MTEKLERLDDFRGSEKYGELDSREKNVLRRQKAAMHAYVEVLRERRVAHGI